MARPKNTIPKARKHSSGLARVTLDGKDYYLGKFGSPEAEEAYRRLIAQWLAKEGPFDPKDHEPVTIQELVAGYWMFAEKYYNYDRNPSRGDCFNLKSSLGILNRLYGSLPAHKFGPLDFKAVQAEMIRLEWSRTYVNHSIGKLKRLFKWAVSEEMIPASVWHALLAVPGLKRGRTKAAETPPVKPIALNIVERTKEYLRPAIRALIDFALLTGCRPNEACQLRPCDIDKSDTRCWIFRPLRHKTANHGHDRLILIGPRAQDVLAFHLVGCDPEEFVFSPCREELRRLEQRRANRRTPHTPSSISRHERAERRIRARHPGGRYTTGSLRTAIHRACDKAGVERWGPNRLRHNRATELRSFGIDNVATILGHAKLETSQVYSEKNIKAAMELMAKVG